jgi:predicted  nucleic acid-binding Zn-ribbon protein
MTYIKSINVLIDYCLTCGVQYFSYTQDENKVNDIG